MSVPLCHSISKDKVTVVFLFGFVIISVLLTATAQETQVQTVENFCPYFKNRAPSPQPDLQNCTWYRTKSCCFPKELTIIFDNIPPPTGANKKCLAILNRLMCYICAPDQNLFYKDERLSVCIEFCDKIYEACGDASLKGSKIKDFYNSGTEFCLSRKFLVGSETNKKCFMPNYLDSESSPAVVQVEVWFIGLLFSVVVMAQ